MKSVTKFRWTLTKTTPITDTNEFYNNSALDVLHVDRNLAYIN